MAGSGPAGARDYGVTMQRADGDGTSDPWAALGASMADVSRDSIELIGRLGWDELLPLLGSDRSGPGLRTGPAALDTRQAKVALDQLGDVVKAAWDRMVDSLPEQPASAGVGDPAANGDGRAAGGVTIATGPGTIVDTVVVVHNGGPVDLIDGRPWCTELVTCDGARLPARVVTFRVATLTLLPTRMDLDLGLSVAIPPETDPGTYHGHLLVSGLTGWSAAVRLTVEPVPEGGGPAGP